MCRLQSKMATSETVENPIQPELVDEKHQVDGNIFTTTTDKDENGKFARFRENGKVQTAWRFVTWTPKRCRWDPAEPPQFSMGLNLLFGFGELCILAMEFIVCFVQYRATSYSLSIFCNCIVVKLPMVLTYHSCNIYRSQSLLQSSNPQHLSSGIQCQ